MFFIDFYSYWFSQKKTEPHIIGIQEAHAYYANVW
jgi:hypothetical protein